VARGHWRAAAATNRSWKRTPTWNLLFDCLIQFLKRDQKKKREYATWSMVASQLGAPICQIFWPVKRCSAWSTPGACRLFQARPVFWASEWCATAFLCEI
jgi:hypothetical protein